MLSPLIAQLMSIVIIVLLLTYQVTSADSAVLIINTIAAGGDARQKPKMHIVVWGLALTLVIGTLLLAGGLDAINTAMIIGALPVLDRHGSDWSGPVQSSDPRRNAGPCRRRRAKRRRIKLITTRASFGSGRVIRRTCDCP